MPFELQIALRYLLARRKQAFISVISAISVGGVALGVTALFVALGLMTGLQSEIRSRILGATAHLSVYRSGGETFDDYREVAAKLRTLPGVAGAAPAFYGRGLLTSGSRSAGVLLKGIVPEEERAVSDLAHQVEEGRFEDLLDTGAGPAPVLLGRELALSLNAGVGDVLTLLSPNGSLSPLGKLPRAKRLRVVGTVRSGLYEFDSGWVWLPLPAAQRVLGDGTDQASQVDLRVHDMYGVRGLAREVIASLGDGFLTTDWIQTNQSLFSALWLEKTAIGITIGLIVAVAALNIVATLVLMVMEKHKDIAILVSMGASRGAVMRVFMLQGTVIGAVGTGIGAAVGWATCYALDHWRLIRVPEDVYQVSYVPFRLVPADAAMVVLGALLICFLATLHPARGAARVDPAEALRYE